MPATAYALTLAGIIFLTRYDMGKLGLIFLLAFSYCSCTSDRKDGRWDRADNSDDFRKFLDKLPKINLPFETNCEECCDHFPINPQSDLVRKFVPTGTELVGLVERTEDRAIIMLTSYHKTNAIVLVVYDINGNQTGKKQFLTDFCGEMPGYYSRQYFRIGNDLSISQIDTTYHMTVDHLRTKDTTKMDITKKGYKVDYSGTIVEEDNGR